MHLNWSTFVLQLVNFAILAWLLQRFLYRPVLRVVDARRAAVEAERTETAKIQLNAEGHLKALEAERAALATERAVALKAATAQGEEAAKVRRTQAAQEAEGLLLAARKTLAEEREQVLVEMRQAALDLAAEITRRLLGELPEALRGEAWLERIEQHIEALPVAGRAMLTGELAARGTLRVVTASALPAGYAEQWRARLLKALGHDAVMTFETDAALIAGAELHFPRSLLDFGLRGVFNTLRSEEASRGKPG
jgi:F-type H+-transporting ATPase subunit b